MGAEKLTTAFIEEVRELVAAGLTATELARRVGKSRGAVLGMVHRHNLGPWRGAKPNGKMPLAIPAEFAELYGARSERDLAEQFGVGRTTVDRWAHQLGIKRHRHRLKAEPAVPRVASPAGSGVFRANRIPLDQPHRDVTAAGRAADFLRRFGPVYRCNARGGAEARGTHWRRGSTVLTPAELIERAERQGYAPEAWRQVAPVRSEERAA